MPVTDISHWLTDITHPRGETDVADSLAMDSDGVNVFITQTKRKRRSNRKRRSTETWRHTLEMTVRASRASGDSEKVPVECLGGQPSHKKDRVTKADESDESDDDRPTHALAKGHVKTCKPPWVARQKERRMHREEL